MFSWLSMHIQQLLGITPSGFYWLVGAIVTALVIIACSDILPPTELAAVDLLGNPFYETGPGGPVLAVPGLMKVRRFESKTRQTEIPAEPELVQKDHQDHVDPGKRAVIRIVQRGADTALWIDKKRFEEDTKKLGHKPFENFFDYFVTWSDYLKSHPEIDEETAANIKKSVFHRPETTEVSAIHEWRHKKGEGILPPQGGCFDFLKNVRTPEEANKRIEDEMVRGIQQVLIQLTPGHTIENEDLISEYILYRMRILIGEEPDPTLSSGEEHLPYWGIGLTKAALKLIDLSERINKAVADAAAEAARRDNQAQQAEADKNTRIKASEAAAIERMNNSDAETYEQVQKGIGRAKEILALAVAARDPHARFLLALETTERVAPNAKMIIAPAIGGQVAAIAAMAQGAADLFKDEPAKSM